MECSCRKYMLQNRTWQSSFQLGLLKLKDVDAELSEEIYHISTKQFETLHYLD